MKWALFNPKTMAVANAMLNTPKSLLQLFLTIHHFNLWGSVNLEWIMSYQLNLVVT